MLRTDDLTSLVLTLTAACLVLPLIDSVVAHLPEPLAGMALDRPGCSACDSLDKDDDGLNRDDKNGRADTGERALAENDGSGVGFPYRLVIVHTDRRQNPDDQGESVIDHLLQPIVAYRNEDGFDERPIAAHVTRISVADDGAF